MTRSEVIKKYLPVELHSMVISNAIRVNGVDWILDRDHYFGRDQIRDRVIDGYKMYRIIDESFNWSRSFEGRQFWSELHEKLENKNL